MRFPLLRTFRELSGRATTETAGLLLHQTAAGLDGARIARRAARGELTSALARQGISVVERSGDEARHALVTSLASTLLPPFDREDMFRVSRSIDDVLDNLRDFVRELDLFDAPDDRFVPVIDAVIDSLSMLQSAISGVVEGAVDVSERILMTGKSCNEIRRNYQEQLAAVLSGHVDADMLRRRELLRRLDVVGLRLGEAVDALADAAVKRGG